MAWIENNAKSGRQKLCFRWNGRKFKHTLRGVTLKDAEAIRHRAEETLGLIERGRLTVPADADFLTYVISEGRITTPIVDPAKPAPLTLQGLFDRYIEIVSNGSLGDNTVYTMKIHFNHIP